MTFPALIAHHWQLSVIQCAPEALPRLVEWQSQTGQDSATPFFSVTQTKDEISVVLQTEALEQYQKQLDILNRSDDWGCIEVVGPLDFSLTGILAGIAGVLEKAAVSIFAISTYNTDFILVKKTDLEKAILALKQAGYPFNS